MALMSIEKLVGFMIGLTVSLGLLSIAVASPNHKEVKTKTSEKGVLTENKSTASINQEQEKQKTNAKTKAKEKEVAEPVLTPPTPIGELQIPYPQTDVKLEAAVTIEVLLTIDEQGAVTLVEQTAISKIKVFDQAVLEGAKNFKFTPALWGETPISVKVPFTQTFEGILFR